MDILLLRHGKTSGNLEHRYVGRTDEKLCQSGIIDLYDQWQMRLEAADEVGDFLRQGKRQMDLPLFVSPMLRCLQSMDILKEVLEVEKAEVVRVKGFREMDFGAFEYKNYQELSGNPSYQAYIDSGGSVGFPGGESLEDFKGRTIRAFQQLLDSYRAKQKEKAAGVVHGGTIMALMEEYARPHKDYFFWQTSNGNGFVLHI